MPNPYLEAGRLRKAVALADYLVAKGFTADLVEVMNREQWRDIAKHAGVNPPNSQESKDMILERLRRLRKVGVVDTAPLALEAPR